MQKSPTLLSIALGTFLSLLSPALTACADDHRLTMMWWNVENLFDTADDPLTEDSEFTPQGRKRWTEKKLLLKCMRLSHIIKVVRLEAGAYPDILVLGEVENREVFERLLSHLTENPYETAYMPSKDPRGIDIALAYNRKKIVLDSALSYRVNLKGSRTRDITLYSFSAKGSPFFLLVNHWPSRALDKAWSEPQRLLAARTARAIIDSLRSLSNRADIIVMGDFNDEPRDTSIGKILNATTDKKAFLENPQERLFNSWGDIDDKGSCFFVGKWLKFDQIMVSYGLFDKKGLSMPDSAFSCFHIPHMQTGNNGRPYATYRGTKYLGGYSDHFPMLLQVIMR
ncbi:MAG: endonuclease [Chlorobiales bacterium]|nr:endonuclease [Chlorobiales bacterium]